MPSWKKSKRLELEARLKPMIEEQKLRQYEAAEQLGVSISWVERACKRLALATQPACQRRGEDHRGWKGGRKLVKGYWYIYLPDHPYATQSRYVSEHRLVMEAKLNRFLLPKEVVHHINGISTDNRPENLMLFRSNSEHLKHELTGRVPNWTPEGKAKLLEACRKPRPSLRKSKSDDDPHTQTSGHQS